ncbi:YveK family protein [Paenibacillus sp. NPDC058071]|uniref:YveK family protein n=1 Tax=Paenibacillus sp. NPDC058071 TaxID=3346326 RepID=UPI0036DD5308
MDFKQYFKIVARKWWLVLILVVLACSAAAVKSYYFTTPVYSAVAKLIVNQSSAVNEYGLPTVGTLQTNLMLIDTYKEIIDSSAILDKVKSGYPQLEDSVYEMSQNLRVSSPNNSQVMNLTYTSSSYESAAATVNAISNVFKEQIPQIMNVDNITILNEAKTDSSQLHAPVNINLTMSIMIAFVLSLIVSVSLVLLLHFTDDRVRSEEELKALVDIPLLASIGLTTKEELRTGRQRIAQPTLLKEAGENHYATLNQ